MRLQVADRVGPDELVAFGAEAVDLEVALGPVQIGLRQIDARRLARAASGRVYADAAGITEQVEEAFAAAHRADARAQWPVIQEQPRVEVIPKIDEELQSVLADFDVLATLVEAAVFLAALAALARFQRDLVARNSKCLAGDAHGFAQPRARKIF